MPVFGMAMEQDFVSLETDMAIAQAVSQEGAAGFGFYDREAHETTLAIQRSKAEAEQKRKKNEQEVVVTMDIELERELAAAQKTNKYAKVEARIKDIFSVNASVIQEPIAKERVIYTQDRTRELIDKVRDTGVKNKLKALMLPTQKINPPQSVRAVKATPPVAVRQPVEEVVEIVQLDPAFQNQPHWFTRNWKVFVAVATVAALGAWWFFKRK